VLLIDDETALGTSLRRCISRYWNASFVNDGRQALELLRHDCGYDVIVCDLMMPEVTGMDIYEELVQSKPDLSKRMLFMMAALLPNGPAHSSIACPIVTWTSHSTWPN